MKACSPEDYPLYDELKDGVAAAKRITDKINEAQRRAENVQTVKNLQGRIEDWKGHHLSGFGDLLLDDIFLVMKSDVDREYHVFLFERIILCCKDAPANSGPPGKKVNKTNSLLKKQTPMASPVLGANSARQKNTPLLLKGRIFLNNVTRAVPASQRHSTGTQCICLFQRYSVY
jgi:cell division control protein 24